MERKSLVVLSTGDQSEMPVGDWPYGISFYLQSLPNYAVGRVLTGDFKWVDPQSINPAAQTWTISPTQDALLAAIAATTGRPTIITWTGIINLTSDIEIQNKSNLELNCYCRGGLSRANSSNMIIIRGGISNCAIRGIDFVNTNTSVNSGSIIRFNEQGTVDGLTIDANTFLNTGTDNNAISSNSSGGANSEFITTHRNITIRRNKFGGQVGSGTGISRMAIELTNHSADGAGPVQVCENIIIEHNEIYRCGTGSDDGFGISVSGPFRNGRVAQNTIVDAKRYSLEGVALCDFVFEGNLVTDIDNTSNGLSLSNGYKGAGAWPDGTMERVIVRNNTFDVKGRGVMSYYYNNCQFTNNTSTSWLANDFIGNDNTLTKNRWTVTKAFNAVHFEQASRNRLVGNEFTTVAYGSGVNTSSVIYFDTGSNDNYLRRNVLTRPPGSFNVHIEEKAGLTNDTGAVTTSGTKDTNTPANNSVNTLNTYATTVTGRNHYCEVATSSFDGSGNTNVAATAGFFKKLPFPTVTSDVEGLWNATNFWYVVPEAGQYVITTVVRPKDGIAAGKRYGQGSGVTAADNPTFLWTQTNTSSNGSYNQRIMSLTVGQQVFCFFALDGFDSNLQAYMTIYKLP